jgi:acetate kinase
MGWTPLEGLMMGTRAGSIDPGIVLRLLEDRRAGLEELTDTLDHRSGLFGVAGTADMREVTDRARAGDARARLAFDLFVRRAAEGIAAAATALPRLDGLVFTGGIGEHAGDVRAAIVDRLAPLGLERLDAGTPSSNPAGDDGQDASDDEDVVLSRRGARVAVLRVTAREDLVIARATASLIEG